MRWIVRIVLSLVLLVILLVAAVFLLPAEKIGALASSQLRQATGRELTLSGRLRPALWPQIGVTTGPVTLSNADWSDEGPMLRAESLSIGLDLSALMGGEIKLRKIEVTAPQILLERSADGRANWEFAGAAEASAQSGEKTARSAPTAFTLDKAVISTGTVRYLDHAAGTSQQVQGLDATLSLPAFDGPAKITLAAKMNGQPVSLDGELGAFGPFLAGKVTPVTADLSAGKAHVAFDGRAGIDPLAADGTMDTDASDLASLFRALGSAPPVLPKGAGRKIALKGRV
ncbi:MAG: AsmA family protein, partial [Paracoccaceae bacterium]